MRTTKKKGGLPGLLQGGLQFRYLPLGTGGTYRSARLPVRGAHYWAIPPKIDCRQSISTVDDRLKGEINRRQSIEGEIDRRRSIERQKGRKKKKRKKKKKKRNTYRMRTVLARAPSPLGRRRRPRVAGALSPSRGEKSRR
ncbi:hypothetical protein BHE74_00021269, partial [Ensete ventricosum]